MIELTNFESVTMSFGWAMKNAMTSYISTQKEELISS